MKVQTVVKDSAEIVRIVQLSPGDVYKRLVKQSYETAYSLRVGIVQDVLNNGERIAVTALEFEHSYSSAVPKIEVFGDDTDLTLFAATPDEVRVYLGEILEAARRQEKSAADAAAKAREILTRIEEIAETEGITAPRVAHDFRPPIEGP